MPSTVRTIAKKRAISQSPTGIVRYRTITTPLGVFAVCEDMDGSLSSRWLHFDDADDQPMNGAKEDKRWQSELFKQLKNYFSGKHPGEYDFTLAPTPRGSPFYQKCWDACRKIKPGTTISYGELAKRAGSPKAVRAAGGAMRHNPLPVIVPCHRVISSTGTLHGFAGETDPDCAPLRLIKRFLEMEQR